MGPAYFFDSYIRTAYAFFRDCRYTVSILVNNEMRATKDPHPAACSILNGIGDSTIINVAVNDDELAEVRQLFVEYADSLDFDLCFQDIESELAGLPGEYGLPEGRLLLARRARRPVGCVAVRALDRRTCEMKRLWVRPAYRRKGIGRELANSIIREARNIGYKTMRLDTVAPSMEAAIQLYQSLGFVEIEPYCENPIPGASFMEIRLQD